MEQEEKGVNLSDQDKSLFRKSRQYLLVGLAAMVGLLFITLSFYWVNLKEASEPSYESSQEAGSQENEDVSVNAQTDYYEYPYIKNKWGDSAVIKENDWGEGGRDIFIRFSYRTETPPELVDIVPMHNNETGPVHFAEKYSDRGYIGRLVYPEISADNHTKAQEETIEKIEIIHDLKKLQEVLGIDSFSDVEELEIQPKFKEWRLMEDRQSRLFYDVTYTDPQNRSNQTTLTYYAAHSNRQNVLSIYSPELENDGNVAATFNDTIDSEVLIIDETSNGYVNVEIDIANKQDAEQQIEIGLGENDKLSVSVYLSAKENVSGTTLREKQENYFCKLTDTSPKVNISNNIIRFSIDARDFYSVGARNSYGGPCRDFVHASLRNIYENTSLDFIVEIRNRTVQENRLLSQIIVSDVLIADNTTRFDDRGYFEETGNEYIFERAFGARNRFPVSCPSNVGVGSSNSSDETDEPLLSTDCGLYKYNQSTEEYDIELTNDLNSLLPESVFGSYADEGLRIIAQAGSRLYLIGYPYEGLTFTNLLYIDVSNVGSGIRDTGYLVETRPALNPAKTLLVAIEDHRDNDLYVLDLQNLFVRSHIVLPEGHTFYETGAMSGSVGITATWKSDSELSIKHRSISKCLEDLTETDYVDQCFISEFELNEQFLENNPEFQNDKLELIETEYVF